MKTAFFRIYNYLDDMIDNRWIRKSISKRGKVSQYKEAILAKNAYDLIWQQVKKYDKKALLYSIRSGEDIDHKGYSHRWAFSFDLPARRAVLVAEVYNDIDSPTFESDMYVEISISPFADKEGSLSTMAREGKILNEYIRSVWKERLDIREYLPHSFVDSNQAVSNLSHQGLEFGNHTLAKMLSAKVLPKQGPVWLVEERHHTFETPFTVS